MTAREGGVLLLDPPERLGVVRLGFTEAVEVDRDVDEGVAGVGDHAAWGVGVAGGVVVAGERHRIARFLEPRFGAAGDVEHQLALDEPRRIVDGAGVVPTVTGIEHDPRTRFRAVQASPGQEREQPAQDDDRHDRHDTGQRETNRPRTIAERPHHRAPIPGLTMTRDRCLRLPYAMRVSS